MNQTAVIFPPLSERELKNAAIAENAAMEGMVLLENRNGALPLSKDQKIAMFGNGAVRTVRGGTGSGDPFNGGLSGGGAFDVDQSPRYHIHILPAMKKAGFEIVNEEMLNAWAEKYDEAKKNAANLVMQSFMFPEEPLTEELLSGIAAETDTAVIVFSRNAGEGHDRTVENDYCFSDTEKKNLELIRKAFPAVILILNVGGPVSTRDVKEADADAVLLMGQSGQEGGSAVTKILLGDVTPSGKLSTTWAGDYCEYPGSDKYLSDPAVSLYEEGIYVGYRYFDTFGRTAGYPFGYGLSYTDFDVKPLDAGMDGQIVRVDVKVTNTGNFAGKEVVQLYVSAPSTELDMPYQELRGFEKTKLLMPGETEILQIRADLRALSSYSFNESAYILSRGYYILRAGTSSVDTVPVAAIRIPETVKTILVNHVLPLRRELAEKTGLQGDDLSKEAEGLPVLAPEKLPELWDRRSPYADEHVTTYTFDPSYQPVMPYEEVKVLPQQSGTYQDLLDGRISVEAFLAQLTEEQLSDFVCGTGWGVADDASPIVGGSSESVPGAAGETTHQLEEKYGVPSIVLADGPGGVRVTQEFTATNVETGEKQTVYHYAIAWPVGTTLAQSFNRETLWEVGLGIDADIRSMNVAVILGPGVNIHRNPLCGRNFEYFSEDPYLAGEMAAAITLGIQNGNTGAANIKHYAANNQETNRHANDSVVSERALREIYLEPFRKSVEQGHAMTFMTSYNLINGVPTADSYDLCINLPRGEWGFDGMIMTDWNGGSSTPRISMHAGNDMIMPGGPMRAMNILTALKKKEPEFDARGQVQAIKLVPFREVYSLKWNAFEPAKDGGARVQAVLGEGYRAEVSEDGRILVDGRPLYLSTGTMFEAFRDPEHFRSFRDEVTTEDAEVSADGKVLTYKVRDVFTQTICIGDVQARAAAILRTIMKLRPQGK